MILTRFWNIKLAIKQKKSRTVEIKANYSQNTRQAAEGRQRSSTVEAQVEITRNTDRAHTNITHFSQKYILSAKNTSFQPKIHPFSQKINFSQNYIL